MRRTIACLGVVALLASVTPVLHHALAQDTRPAIADPATAYLVEGRVLLQWDRPGANLAVDRVSDETGRTLFSAGAYSTRTDAEGRFRFSFAGLGLSTGWRWHIAIRRPNCPTTVATIHLHEGRVPPTNQEGDVATNVVVRVPHCHVDPATAPTAAAHQHPTNYPPVGPTIAVYYEGRSVEVDLARSPRPAGARAIPFLSLWHSAIGGADPAALRFDPIGSDGFRSTLREECAHVLTGRELRDATIDIATHDLSFPAGSTLAHCYQVHHIVAVDVR